MKKLLCGALALTLLFALAIPGFAADTKTMYCSAPEDWTACYVHWWNSSGDTIWPGMSMQQGTDGVWYYDVPADAQNIIFHNNSGNQSADLNIPTNGMNQFDYSQKTWSVYGEDPVPLPPATDYYLVGYINGADYGIMEDAANMGEYHFVDGKLTASFTADSYVVVKDNNNTQYWCEAFCTDTTTTLVAGASEKMFVPANQTLEFTLVVNEDATLTLSYQPKCDHAYTDEITTAATCDGAGEKTFTCSKCGHSYTEAIAALGHNFVNGICSVCNTAESDVPDVTWYLVGYINGKDYGIEADIDNLGDYRFADDGKLSTKFEADSYVVVKNDKKVLYLTEAFSQETSATFYENGKDKMFVPGGKDLTFSLTVNTDGSVTLSYTAEGSDCAHNYTEKVTTAATCDKDGVKTFTCSLCAHSYTEKIPAGHTMVNNVCSVCGYKKPADGGTSKNTIFAQVPDSWTTVNAYTWDSGNTAQNGEWPGTAMVKDGSWYRIEINDKCANFIINNGKDQTKDLKIEPGKDVYVIVNDDLSTTISYDNPKDFPLSNFRVVGNAEWMGNWDPANEVGRMHESGENEYFLDIPDVKPGKYEFKITQNGTWDKCWGDQDGNNVTFEIKEKTRVRIYFKLNGDKHTIDVEYDRFGDQDMTGVMVLMVMALTAASALLLFRKRLTR